MDRVSKKTVNKKNNKKTNQRVNPKINKKNKKNKKYSKNDTLIKLGLVITVIVFVVIIFKILHKEKVKEERISITNNTLYQYFMGEKSEYTGKIEIFKENDDTKLVADDDITVYPDTVPIYYKDILGKAMFAKEMELVTVDEGMYKLNDYTEINTVNNDIFAKRFNKKEQKALINSFIYDGSDLYFFLDNTTVRIGETASFFNLSDMLDKKISDLSGGKRAVVAIASVMISDVDALILDEPLNQLDPKSTYHIISLLKRVNEELGVTVIMSSHTADNIADFCDRMIILEEGKIVLDDSPRILKKSEKALEYLPVYTSLFNERPLTVREAVPLAELLEESEYMPGKSGKTSAQLKNITFSYSKKERDILSSLTFEAYTGTVHSIIGANGSGKTTLLKVLAGIKKAYSGRVKVNGKIAYMPQNPKYLFTKDTVREEIDENIAQRFGLSDCLEHHPYDLSIGQMQKLALAILSAQDFNILLLDEPSKALDSFSKNGLKKYIRDLAKQGKTVIIVSHDLDFVGDVSDYVSFLSDGIITITGERRYVLSSLNYYTTQIRRITKPYLKSAVSAEDLK